MTEEESIVGLLREIRDQQRAYAEWHRAFAEKLIEQNRVREQDSQKLAVVNQAEVRKSQRDIKFIFGLIVAIVLFARPIGDWIMVWASRK